MVGLCALLHMLDEIALRRKGVRTTGLNMNLPLDLKLRRPQPIHIRKNVFPDHVCQSP